MADQTTIDAFLHGAGESSNTPMVLAPVVELEPGPAMTGETSVPEISPIEAPGISGASANAGKGAHSLGAGISAFFHFTAVALVFYVTGAASTFNQTHTIPVELVIAAPPSASVNLPAPAAPPEQLSAELLPAPKLPPPAAPPELLSTELLPAPDLPLPAAPPLLTASLLPGPELPPPDRPAALTVDLLPAPKVKPPAPPAALASALLPAPRVDLPPLPPDPAGVLARALPRKFARVEPLDQPRPTSQAKTQKVRPRQQPVQKSQKANADKSRLEARALARQRARKAAQLRKAKILERKRARLQQRNRAAAKRRLAKEKLEKAKRQKANAKANAKAKAKARTAARRKSRERLRLASRSRNSTSAARSTTRRSSMSAGAYRGIVAARLRRNMPSGNLAMVGQGTAVVTFKIAASGAAVAIRLARSAGHKALDRAAMATVRRASPFPAPPNSASRSYRIPVRFRR